MKQRPTNALWWSSLCFNSMYLTLLPNLISLFENFCKTNIMVLVIKFEAVPLAARVWVHSLLPICVLRHSSLDGAAGKSQIGWWTLIIAPVGRKVGNETSHFGYLHFSNFNKYIFHTYVWLFGYIKGMVKNIIMYFGRVCITHPIPCLSTLSHNSFCLLKKCAFSVLWVFSACWMGLVN